MPFGFAPLGSGVNVAPTSSYEGPASWLETRAEGSINHWWAPATRSPQTDEGVPSLARLVPVLLPS
jgi:hypothetical protein